MSHIPEAQVYTIGAMEMQGYKQVDIAMAICKDKPAVSREFGRNFDIGQWLTVVEKRVRLGDLEIDFYFAHPYHSWERGSNENLNGLIRQYIPQKTEFSTISDAYV